VDAFAKQRLESDTPRTGSLLPEEGLSRRMSRLSNSQPRRATAADTPASPASELPRRGSRLSALRESADSATASSVSLSEGGSLPIRGSRVTGVLESGGVSEAGSAAASGRLGSRAGGLAATPGHADVVPTS
jgi:hypothetical protein